MRAKSQNVRSRDWVGSLPHPTLQNERQWAGPGSKLYAKKTKTNHITIYYLISRIFCIVLWVETVNFIPDDKKPTAIRAFALLSFAAIILLWALQPITITIPLGNQHTDWLFVDGMRYMAYDYDHSENPPIRYNDVLVLNPDSLSYDFHVHYEYEIVEKTHLNGNEPVNEFVHPVLAQRHLHANGHAFAQFVCRN